MKSGTVSWLTTLVIGIFPTLMIVSAVYAAGEGDHGHAGEAQEMRMSKADIAAPDHVPLKTAIRLVIPAMDAAKGKELFINKACITCHAVNGVGGKDGPRIDAHVMAMEMNVFEFGARMWNHAQVMTAVQIAALGAPIRLTGEELGHITAFAHDDAEQHTVRDTDIPHHIREKMHHEHSMEKDTH